MRFSTDRLRVCSAVELVQHSESPSGGKCAKLRTVAASNNRGHAPQSLCYCLFAPHICIGVVLRAHSVRGESRIRCNASGVVATLVKYNFMKLVHVRLLTRKQSNFPHWYLTKETLLKSYRQAFVRTATKQKYAITEVTLSAGNLLDTLTH